MRALLSFLGLVLFVVAFPGSLQAQGTPKVQQVPPPIVVAHGCHDAQLRFPNADQPRRAVMWAIQDLGGNPYVKNPFMERRLEQSPKIVGAWIGVSLMGAWRGWPPITLAAWIEKDPTFSFVFGGPDWIEMLSWPAHTCEGAFVQHPGNADLMLLVRMNVIETAPSSFPPLPLP